MANPKGNPQNFWQNQPPEKQPTAEQRRKNARKAGKASGKAAGERKKFREEVFNALQAVIKDKDGNEHTVQEAGVIAMLQRWVKTGDPRITELILEIVGEKPKNEISISGSVNNPFSGLTTEELKKLVDDD